MPTQLPTKTVCLNCNFEVKTENKYCPNCGQENADKRISLFLLLEDAVATAFNFESRVFKTIPYFLFYPGRLTNEFLAGRRVRYMHPFKIYLLSSILFFFVIIKLFTPALEDSIRKIDKTSEEINIELSLDDSTSEISKKIQQRQIILKDSISEVLAKIKTGNIDSSLINIDSLEFLVQDSAALAETFGLFNETAKEKNNSWRRFFRLIKDRKMTPDVLLDSLNNQDNNAINIQFAEQLLKIGRNDPAIFLANIINNIGTLMFFTLPILAFCFMPFYFRSKKYYIDHLIFTLHLQAFTFVILTIAALFFHWNFIGISLIVLLGLIIYVWFAFKKVYKQGFWKTTIKAYIISILYATILIFMLSINLLYSFFMF
ncbi:Protein of unknown function (DUF3667) [Bernardetia litoralis DSM 6794]|uniref:DUF3667 domain-containing protein n=1 Tax=Bernardetia litoralis (strain ATCC 23117 / DSM 6794 / NBRC 15988 / NCIMB 1366 / Fx l1 / Sio-4) TaxID=880071 RepID=I4AG58_BERLS|nr:DUF3667 domain-containing protein [Bernardetia litoralis]AFM02943.1 Protein of unknown function (DUF3667) [Bernardetia litoralis DSM 6794]